MSCAFAFEAATSDDDALAILSESSHSSPGPGGITPLHANLAWINGRFTQGAHPEGDTIVIVLTDGEPSDTTMPKLQQLIKGRDKSVYMTFAMCTEEDDVVEKYNQCIDPIWGCDISDDYASEKKEVEAHGNKLSMNKWLAKIVLGGYMPKYDNMDEPKKLCCSIQ